MSKISFFRAPASSIVPYKDICLVDIYHYITGPYAAERTAKLRSIDDKKVKGIFKRTKFDYVTFSGTFTRRTDADLVAHSGYLCLDFDHLDDAGNLTAARSVLLQDPHFETLLLFTSPSGKGLKWVIPIGNEFLPIGVPDATRESCGGESEGRGRFNGSGGASPCDPRAVREDHRTWFNAVRNYLATTYHLDADPACVNVSRSCFLPHDPDCYIAPRLLPELEPVFAENPEVLNLMTSLCATNIKIENNEQAE